jgi:transcription-repair coupling factor (superfamily II helicase)
LDEAIQELKEDEFTDLFKEEQTHKIESKDCVIETDYEALIPDHYVRSTSERLSLYNELSSIGNDDDLVKYASHLRDRFGPLPQQVIDLIELISLREVAKKLGFEKIVLKNAQFAGFFPDEKKQHYYQSEIFSKILQFTQQNGSRCKLKQTPKSLILNIQHVSGIAHTKKILGEI